jgi:hypothetical protein
MINIRITLFITIIISTYLSTEAQIENPRDLRKHGISLTAGGDYTVVGLAYDVFLTPSSNMEFNASLIFPGFGASYYYHPWGMKNTWRWSPYTGLHLGYNSVGFWTMSNSFSAYIPAGVHYISDYGFYFNASAGLMYNDYSNERGFGPMMSLKIGYRFYSGKKALGVTERMKKKKVRTSTSRKNNKYGISLSSKGYINPFGMSADMFLLDQLEVELNAFFIPVEETGYPRGMGAGLNYHPWGGSIHRRVSPYVGAYFGILHFKVHATSELEDAFYFPVGIQYIFNSGIYFSIDLGYINLKDIKYFPADYYTYYKDMGNYNGPWTRTENRAHRINFGFKLGYRF